MLTLLRIAGGALVDAVRGRPVFVKAVHPHAERGPVTPLTDQELRELAFKHHGGHPQCSTCRLLATLAQRDAELARLRGAQPRSVA